MIKSKEIWKDIPGYEGLYQVSNLGRIKSLQNRTIRGEFILKLSFDKNGYLITSLSKNKVKKMYRVHRLVAEAFIPNDDPEHKIQCNHRDENKQNNTVWINADGSIDPEKSNLEWVTPSVNTNYGTRNERVSKKMTNGKLSKPVKQITLDNILITVWPSINEAARNGFNAGCIWACCQGKVKKHKGFIWKY